MRSQIFVRNMIGTKLAHYEITSHIGSGGMGDVYQATDTKLGRSVAIKFLPEVFSHDTERLARFQREARVLALLNQPGIAAIYGLELIDGRHFLVMELALGETVAERIRRGPILLEETLAIAKQITEALEEAHEKGVVHRDLKPANIKVTPDGKVKVLDFGLAKAYQREQADTVLSNSPTVSMAASNAGVILGTAAYMSPEQARGKALDRRTDIWALGCVLYEMLTGKPAFGGDDVTEILASVVKSEPDWSLLPAATPALIRRLLRRCLEKDPKRRFHSAADVQIQMEDATAASSVAPPVIAVATSGRNWKRSLVWGYIGGAACILIVMAVWKFQPSASMPPVTRFTVSMPQNRTLVPPGGPFLTCSTLALSPNGSLLAYVTSGGNRLQTYLRSMDNLESKLVPGSEVTTGGPFFSPDGESLAFGAEDKLKKVPTKGGGAAVTIAGNESCWPGATWSTGDDIVLPHRRGLVQFPASGGNSSEVLVPQDTGKGNVVTLLMPEFLPGDRAIVFTAVPSGATTTPLSGPAFDEFEILVRKLDTGEQHVLVQGGTSPHYASTGHLLFARAGTIMAVPFDLKRLQLTGKPVALVEGLARNLRGVSEFSVSRNGTLAYISGPQEGEQARTLVWVDRKGTVQPIEAPARGYAQPQISPDGQQIAVAIENPKNDVWVYDLARGTLTRLTFEGNNNSRPLWTPDGKSILFRSDKAGPGSNLFLKLADGTGSERQITNFAMNLPTSISPDGKLAFFYKRDPKTSSDIWMVPLEGDLKPAVVLQTPFIESAAKISPDGKFLAYHSNEAGHFEVYVRSFPGPGGKWQISTDGGNGPVWSRNGRELFYRNGDKMMAVDIMPGQSFKAGSPHLLFEGQFARRPGTDGEANYDISPDGQRFLMIKAADAPQTVAQLHVVLNWFRELQERVPVK
jgi:serine/threonine-protein kinase